jgi:hypothetical protein
VSNYNTQQGIYIFQYQRFFFAQITLELAGVTLEIKGTAKVYTSQVSRYMTP